MIKSCIITILIAVSLALAGCGAKKVDSFVDQGARKLTAVELKQLLTGSTIKMEGVGGDEAELHFKNSRKVVGKNVHGDEDPGTWKVTAADNICMEFRLWGDGDRICYQAYKNDGEYYLFNSKGMLMYTFTVIDQGGEGFKEGISFSTLQKQVDTVSNVKHAQEEGRPAPSSSAAPINSGPPPITPQTRKDINYIMRQTAANCPGCNLAQAQLSSANLVSANLEGANLTGADLSFAILRRANLRGANLYKADLRHADLTGADLTGANLTDAQLDDADIAGATGLRKK